MTDPSNISEHSRGVALALATATGVFGGHRFYVGKIGTGLLMLGTFGGLGIWYLYDLIVVAAGAFRDGDGKRVVEWGVQEQTGRHRSLKGEQGELILEEMDGLRMDVSELQERVDFMERMLTSLRDRNQIPPSSST